MALLAIAGGVAWYLTRVSPEAAALRQKFAYVSLSDRLSYEARHIPEDSDHDDPIFLGPTLKRLDAAEDPSVMAWNGDRMESLLKMHSREATRIVNSQGKGKTR
ncbi:MAG: hypothetical protein HY290_24530, partial [Planctomycetia bacterium]|nr:hypothetical protein [Planctomycetia bacterium]